MRVGSWSVDGVVVWCGVVGSQKKDKKLVAIILECVSAENGNGMPLQLKQV